MAKKAELVKLFVALRRDADGYPPVDWEELWAIDVGGGSYRIDNIPFYAPLLSYGDTVATELRDQRLVITQVVTSAGHSTIHIIAYDDAIVQGIRQALRDVGCQSEVSNIPTFVAVDVPPDVEYSTVKGIVDRFAKAGSIDYEESSLRH